MLGYLFLGWSKVNNILGSTKLIFSLTIVKVRIDCWNLWTRFISFWLLFCSNWLILIFSWITIALTYKSLLFAKNALKSWCITCNFLFFRYLIQLINIRNVFLNEIIACLRKILGNHSISLTIFCSMRVNLFIWANNHLLTFIFRYLFKSSIT